MRKCLVSIPLYNVCNAETFLLISLFHMVSCLEIPAPINLNISSEHLVHLLTWEMGPDCPAGVHYTVRMRTRSSRGVKLVKGCETVTSPLHCNLTEAFSDPFETYYTSVSAVLRNNTSPPAHCSPFRPIVNSTLESPLVSVTVCNTSLCVSLRSPSPDLQEMYNSFRFHYRLKITTEDQPASHEDVEGLQNVTLNVLTPGRRYCVTVIIIDHKYSSRPAVCVSTPETNNISVKDVLIAVVLCLLMVLLVMCAIPRLLSHFLCQKVKMPQVLKSFLDHKVHTVLLIPESVSILTVDILEHQMLENTDEHDETQEDTEEGSVMYEKLAAQHLKAQDSSSNLGFVSESSCGIHSSLADVQSCGSSVDEGDNDSHHILIAETQALLKCADVQDGAVLEDEDVNLCSVILLHNLCSTIDDFDSFETHGNIQVSECEQESEEEYSDYLSRS